MLCHAAEVELEIGFLLRGSRGRVHVDLRPAAGAASSGRDALDPSLPAAHGAGLPVCTATIDYAGTGYAAAMGWVQFVRSTDSTRPDIFELDPLALYNDVNTPYAFFGITPTLFDAPYRDAEQDLVWQARSYLATTPAAVPLLAFTWGFRISGLATTQRSAAGRYLEARAGPPPRSTPGPPGHTSRDERVQPKPMVSEDHSEVESVLGHRWGDWSAGG